MWARIALFLSIEELFATLQFVNQSCYATLRQKSFWKDYHRTWETIRPKVLNSNGVMSVIRWTDHHQWFKNLVSAMTMQDVTSNRTFQSIKSWNTKGDLFRPILCVELNGCTPIFLKSEISFAVLSLDIELSSIQLASNLTEMKYFSCELIPGQELETDENRRFISAISRTIGISCSAGFAGTDIFPLIRLLRNIFYAYKSTIDHYPFTTTTIDLFTDQEKVMSDYDLENYPEWFINLHNSFEGSVCANSLHNYTLYDAVFSPHPNCDLFRLLLLIRYEYNGITPHNLKQLLFAAVNAGKLHVIDLLLQKYEDEISFFASELLDISFGNEKSLELLLSDRYITILKGYMYELMNDRERVSLIFTETTSRALSIFTEMLIHIQWDKPINFPLDLFSAIDVSKVEIVVRLLTYLFENMIQSGHVSFEELLSVHPYRDGRGSTSALHTSVQQELSVIVWEQLIRLGANINEPAETMDEPKIMWTVADEVKTKYGNPSAQYNTIYPEIPINSILLLRRCFAHKPVVPVLVEEQRTKSNQKAKHSRGSLSSLRNINSFYSQSEVTCDHLQEISERIKHKRITVFGMHGTLTDLNVLKDERKDLRVTTSNSKASMGRIILSLGLQQFNIQLYPSISDTLTKKFAKKLERTDYFVICMDIGNGFGFNQVISDLKHYNLLQTSTANFILGFNGNKNTLFLQRNAYAKNIAGVSDRQDLYVDLGQSKPSPKEILSALSRLDPFVNNDHVIE